VRGRIRRATIAEEVAVSIFPLRARRGAPSPDGAGRPARLTPRARTLLRCGLAGYALLAPPALAAPTAASGYTIREVTSGFTLPLGIAVDSADTVWVSDSTEGTISTVVAGVATVVAAGVSCPRSMVFVDTGDFAPGLYTLGAPVDDCPDGAQVVSLVDTTSGSSAVSWETPDPGAEHWPFDLAWSDDATYGTWLYVVDSAGPPDAAIILHADSSYTTLEIPENLGSLAFGVGADWEGSLYAVVGSHGEVTDSTLYAVDPAGGLTPITSRGSFSLPGQMRFPTGTGAFPAGAYVTDSGVVERVDPDGTLTEIVSGLSGTNLGRGALAFDTAGDTLYLAEAGSGTIWAVTPTTDDDADGDGSLSSDDCDDADPAVNPDAAETCDGVDDDCDGLTDAEDPDVTGTSTQYEDADADGWGDPSTARGACDDHAGWVAVAQDCDDADPAVNPDAEEVCENGADDDCDTTTPDACPDTGDDTGGPALSVASRCGCVGAAGGWSTAPVGLALLLARRRARVD